MNIKNFIKRRKLIAAIIFFYTWSIYYAYSNKESFYILCKGTTRSSEIDTNGMKTDHSEEEVKVYYFNHQSLNNYDCYSWDPEYIMCKGDESKSNVELNGDYIKVKQYLTINRDTGEILNATERIQSKSGKTNLRNIRYSGFCIRNNFDTKAEGKIL